MEPPARPRWSVRALATVIAALLAAGAGVLAARVTEEQPAAADVVVLVEPAPQPLPDLTPIANVSAALVGGLRADLPVPEPSPRNPRAATPEIRHGLLEIPSIGLAQPFFEGVTLTSIDRGPSHWPGTAMPGQLGNVVIAGHRTTKTRPFWDLDRVQPGAELIFTMADGARHVYTLDRTQVVDDDDIYIIDQTYGYRATLFGCHPKGSARQRMVGHFTLQSSTPPPSPLP